MVEIELFPNPPITESVLEISVILPENIETDTLKGFHSDLNEKFPEIIELRAFKAGFRLGKDTAILPSENALIGYHFKSSPHKKLIQFRLNGFAFNKLKPYENWNNFCSEAHELWDYYREKTNPSKITRISLRYINRIEVPLPFKDFNEYILINPQIPPNLPQELSQLFMRLEIPKDDIGANAIIIQTIEPATTEKKLPLIFDIDVIRESEYIKNMDDIWADFENLHDFKNEIFFKGITDKTKELFR